MSAIEHGMLFSAPMVRAILAGRKSQTRRVVTSKNSLVDGSPPCMKRDPEILGAWHNLDFTDAFVDPGPSPAGNPGPYLRVADAPNESRHRVYPRVQPSDRLWVRETWCQVPGGDDYVYRADLSDEHRLDELAVRRSAGALATSWRPSIFMPRRAARIVLTVSGVRAQRLQDITDADALGEGVPGLNAFRALWESINGHRPGCAWADNAWVWALAFERVELNRAREQALSEVR